MALVFSLRLMVTGLAFLFGSCVLFVFPFSDEREWESLLVLFSVFMILVSYVLLFIRLSRHSSRLVLLSALCPLVLPSAGWVALGVWLAGLAVMEVLRRESEGLSWFLWAQGVLGVGGLVTLLVPSPGVLIIIWTVTGFTIAALFAVGCWSWQDRLRQDMTRSDLDTVE